MSTETGGIEWTRRRPLPDWQYAYPDKRNDVIALQADVIKILAADAARLEVELKKARTSRRKK